MQNEQGVAGGHENAIPGPHHGPHVSQLNRDYANLLRERDPSLYEDLVREPTEEFQFDETSKNLSQSWCDDAMVEMVEDIYIARERPFTKRDARCHDALKKEADTPIYENAKLSRLSATLLILNLQARHKWTNESTTALLEYVSNLLLCLVLLACMI